MSSKVTTEQPPLVELLGDAGREAALLALDDERDLLRAPALGFGIGGLLQQVGKLSTSASGSPNRFGAVRPSNFSAERLTSVTRLPRPMTPADTRKHGLHEAATLGELAVGGLKLVRWLKSSLVMALKLADNRRRSPSPRRIGSSALRASPPGQR